MATIEQKIALKTMVLVRLIKEETVLAHIEQYLEALHTIEFQLKQHKEEQLHLHGNTLDSRVSGALGAVPDSNGGKE